MCFERDGRPSFASLCRDASWNHGRNNLPAWVKHGLSTLTTLGGVSFHSQNFTSQLDNQEVVEVEKTWYKGQTSHVLWCHAMWGWWWISLEKAIIFGAVGGKRKPGRQRT